jgi:Spy/CpxP family protein refolding chaperone
MSLQQKEFERQVIALRDLYDKLQKSNSDDAKAEQQKRLEELSQRHYQLRLRVDEQVRSLVNCYQPDLSNEEQEFVSKLERLSKQISGDAGYAKRIEMVKRPLIN